MTIGEWAQVVVAIVSVLTLALSMSNNYQIKIIHKATNHMKDELVHEVREASFAAGQKDQLASDKR